MPFPVRYQPIVNRPPLRFEDGTRCAVCVVINVEYFEPDVASTSVNPSSAQLTPDVFNYSWREYGARVGIWRLLDVLDRNGVRASVALNSDVCTYYPELVLQFMRRAWCLLGHGTTNSQLLNGLPEEAERRVIIKSIVTIAQTTGAKPNGWLSPALAETWNTPALLEELGIEYLCDWLNDEEPYRFDTPQQKLVGMPYSNELNDIHCFLRCAYTAQEYFQILTDQFDILYEESHVRPKVMTIPLHPFIIGHPYRSKYLELALRYMRSHADVKFCTTSDIYQAYINA